MEFKVLILFLIMRYAFTQDFILFEMAAKVKNQLKEHSTHLITDNKKKQNNTEINSQILIYIQLQQRN